MVLKESLFEEVAFRVMTQITQVGHEKVKGENENQGPKKTSLLHIQGTTKTDPCGLSTVRKGENRIRQGLYSSLKLQES